MSTTFLQLPNVLIDYILKIAYGKQFKLQPRSKNIYHQEFNITIDGGYHHLYLISHQLSSIAKRLFFSCHDLDTISFRFTDLVATTEKASNIVNEPLFFSGIGKNHRLVIILGQVGCFTRLDSLLINLRCFKNALTHCDLKMHSRTSWGDDFHLIFKLLFHYLPTIQHFTIDAVMMRAEKFEERMLKWALLRDLFASKIPSASSFSPPTVNGVAIGRSWQVCKYCKITLHISGPMPCDAIKCIQDERICDWCIQSEVVRCRMCASAFLHLDCHGGSFPSNRLCVRCISN